MEGNLSASFYAKPVKQFRSNTSSHRKLWHPEEKLCHAWILAQVMTNEIISVQEKLALIRTKNKKIEIN